MSKDQIYTEDEEMLRQLDNMIHSKGKSCKNCQWGNYDPKEPSDFVTCGTHIQNFKVNSMCDAWIDPEDPNLLAYQKRRQEAVLKKLNSTKPVK